MQHAQILEQARQGNAGAIAALLTQRLRPHGVRAKARFQKHHLQVLLESPQAIGQRAILESIQDTLVQLDLPTLQSVQIHARLLGQPQPLWTATLDLSLREPKSEDAIALSDLGDPFELDHPSEASVPVSAQTTMGSSIPPLNSLSPSQQLPQRQLDPIGKQAIAGGCFLALLIMQSRQVAFFLQPLLTVVHELGHTAANWLFGYIAIPAFDFIYGGGVTMQLGERSTVIMALIYSGIGYLFYRYWQNVQTARLLLGLTLVYLICAYTALREMIILAMGHGFELTFASIFLYQALSGFGCRTSIERGLYGMLGCFILLYDLRFASRLLLSASERAIYEAGKGGLLDHDFVRLARDYFQVDLSLIVLAFLGCCLMVPGIAWLLFRHEARIAASLYRRFWITDDRQALSAQGQLATRPSPTDPS